ILLCGSIYQNRQMKVQLVKLFQVVFILVTCTSCYYNKRMVYFQDKDYSESFATQIKNENTLYRLQPNDVLSVKVKSSTEANISDIFNITPSTNFFNVDAGNVFLQGYSIDGTGAIVLPILGKLVVRNLTVEEAQELIQS